MNFTESFQEFSSRLGPTDLALYAGVGIVLFVLFKDRLSPVQEAIKKLVDTVKTKLPVKASTTVVSATKSDVFFDLIVSWKRTRDLAEQSGCTEALKVADQMFPFLTPNACTKENKE